MCRVYFNSQTVCVHSCVTSAVTYGGVHVQIGPIGPGMLLRVEWPGPDTYMLNFRPKICLISHGGPVDGGEFAEG